MFEKLNKAEQTFVASQNIGLMDQYKTRFNGNPKHKDTFYMINQDPKGSSYITEKERDELEALWIERENLRNHTDENGIYQDLVTKALGDAEIFLMELWEEDIQKAEAMRKQFDDEIKEAEEEWQRIKEQNRKEKHDGN